MERRTAVNVRSWFGQQIALLLLLLITAGSAWGAEMVTNGAFATGGSGWTLSTATYDSTTGGGSVKIATATGRNGSATGTVTQTLASPIPAGSTVSAASISTMLNSNYEVTGDNVTVALRYTDSTTVTIIGSGELVSGTWTAATGGNVTLAMNATAIVITMNAKSGNNSNAVASLWVDDLSITYTAPPPIKPPPAQQHQSGD